MFKKNTLNYGNHYSTILCYITDLIPFDLIRIFFWGGISKQIKFVKWAFPCHSKYLMIVRTSLQCWEDRHVDAVLLLENVWEKWASVGKYWIIPNLITTHPNTKDTNRNKDFISFESRMLMIFGCFCQRYTSELKGTTVPTSPPSSRYFR